MVERQSSYEGQDVSVGLYDQSQMPDGDSHGPVDHLGGGRGRELTHPTPGEMAEEEEDGDEADTGIYIDCSLLLFCLMLVVPKVDDVLSLSNLDLGPFFGLTSVLRYGDVQAAEDGTLWDTLLQMLL